MVASCASCGAAAMVGFERHRAHQLPAELGRSYPRPVGPRWRWSFTAACFCREPPIHAALYPAHHPITDVRGVKAEVKGHRDQGHADAARKEAVAGRALTKDDLHGRRGFGLTSPRPASPPFTGHPWLPVHPVLLLCSAPTSLPWSTPLPPPWSTPLWFTHRFRMWPPKPRLGPGGFTRRSRTAPPAGQRRPSSFPNRNYARPTCIWWRQMTRRVLEGEFVAFTRMAAAGPPRLHGTQFSLDCYYFLFCFLCALELPGIISSLNNSDNRNKV